MLISSMFTWGLEMLYSDFQSCLGVTSKIVGLWMRSLEVLCFPQWQSLGLSLLFQDSLLIESA